MKFIAHRINTIQELAGIPEEYGVEVDLRDRGDRLVMVHDPFSDGEDFEEFAGVYRHGTLILNIKSERIEHRVQEVLVRHNITDYFFLDSSFPMIRLLADSGERKIALRFSEFEGMDTIRAMAGKVEWVWVDCFSKIPLTKELESEIHTLGYKICFVSPELQGRSEDLERYRDFFEKEKIALDAVCSKIKNRSMWISSPVEK